MPKNSIKYPYRAVIFGEEHIIQDWSGESLSTDKGQYTFNSFKKNGKPSWPPECRLLEIATIQSADAGEWLLNGCRLSLLQFLPSGKRLFSITQDEDLRIFKHEIYAVGWYLAVSAGSQTAELDMVLADWKRAKEAFKPDAKQLFSRLNSSFFIGWSNPTWLTRFHPMGGNDPWLAGLSKTLQTGGLSQKPAMDSVADMLKKGINPYLAGLENISPQSASAQVKVTRPTKKTLRTSHPKPVARFENDFTIAVIPQKGSKVSRLAVEEELRKLIKEIVQAGGNKPRIELRRGKSLSWQPDKLLTSRTAKALMKAGLLCKEKNGRTVVYSARESAR